VTQDLQGIKQALLQEIAALKAEAGRALLDGKPFTKQARMDIAANQADAIDSADAELSRRDGIERARLLAKQEAAARAALGTSLERLEQLYADAQATTEKLAATLNGIDQESERARVLHTNVSTEPVPVGLDAYQHQKDLSSLIALWFVRQNPQWRARYGYLLWPSSHGTHSKTKLWSKVFVEKTAGSWAAATVRKEQAA